MYAGEDGEVCVELGYAGKALSASKAKQPDKSKAGGWPAWFGEAPVDVAGLVCHLCGRFLYLVTQVYAPTHVERSLCVFGCNRATCSLRSEGWRVVRTQAPPPPREQPPETVRDENAPAVPTADNNSGAAVSMAGIMPPTPPGPSQEVRAPTTGVAWGESNVSWDDAAPGEDDEWGAELSEWGSGAATEGVGHGTAADIGALLDEREKLSSTARGGSALPTTAAVGGGVCGKSTSIGPRPDGASDGQVGPADASGPGGISSTAPSTAVENGDGGGRPCFPAKTVSFMPEPWGAESSGADDKDMKNRLRRYREQEEDRGLVAALDQALGLKESGVTGNSQQGLQGAGGGAASIGEKYERTPARAKAVMRFADRVARSPQQVVRYAYGGQPLWSAFDPPKEEVPPCACGATRVFEMQLMPALLLQLKANDLADREPIEQQGDVSSATPVDPVPKNKTTFSNKAGGDKNAITSAPPSVTPQRAASTPPSGDNGTIGIPKLEAAGGTAKSEEVDGEDAEKTAMPTPSAEERERLRTRGMDWGVVGVWSCPRSCDVSREECVVVQLPV